MAQDLTLPIAAATAPTTTGPQAPAKGAKGAVSGRRIEAAARAAQDFEAVYLSFMLQNMFTGISTDGPFSGGEGEKMFRSQLHQEMGRILSRSGGVGLADTVFREIMRHQEA